MRMMEGFAGSSLVARKTLAATPGSRQPTSRAHLQHRAAPMPCAAASLHTLIERQQSPVHGKRIQQCHRWVFGLGVSSAAAESCLVAQFSSLVLLSGCLLA
jgi:hypothetical protein